jgi:polyhydroxyalkanoate synthase subunit PhaC
VSAMVAAVRPAELASLFLGVTVLDPSPGGVSSLASQRTLELAVAASRARGYLDGAALAEVFAWLRPNDLIWNYWVNNYLQGRTPPPFDILYWNADTTRMPAALHRDFIRLFTSGSLVKPGAAGTCWTGSRRCRSPSAVARRRPRASSSSTASRSGWTSGPAAVPAFPCC